eukprot:jgi/Phyca11/121675/e_gw1.44.398.1
MVYASLRLINLVLKQNFGFFPVYQLAFVLETQIGTPQGHLFRGVLWILQITLVRNGKFCNFELLFCLISGLDSVGVDLNAPFK